ncbi:MAG: hypothetical protein OEM01_04470 [Desulfobulbaceae bacterium]|nr:hypothetical protein [Desulfobulbaceae bacterium]
MIRMYRNEAFNPDSSLNPEHSGDLYSITSATFTPDHLDEEHTQGNKNCDDEMSRWYAYEEGVLVGPGSASRA